MSSSYLYDNNFTTPDYFGGCMNYTNSTHSLVPLPVRESWILYAGLFLAIEICLVNAILLFLFFKQRTTSPITVLLGSLAFTDTMSAIMRFVPKFIAYTAYAEHLVPCDYNGYSYLWLVPSHSCKISVWIELMGSTVFHDTSAFITVILCIERVIILIYPIKSRHYLGKCVTVFAICVGFVMACSYNMPQWVATLDIPYFATDSGYCLVNHLNFAKKYKELETITMKTCSIVYAVVLSIIIFCTVVISTELTCLRNIRVEIHNERLNRRNQRGGLLVIIICVIFILSELPNYIYHFLFNFQKQSTYLFTISNKYRHLVMELGFSMNFIVYMVMNKQFRDILILYLECILTFGKKKKAPHLTKSSTFFKL